MMHAGLSAKAGCANGSLRVEVSAPDVAKVQIGSRREITTASPVMKPQQQSSGHQSFTRRLMLRSAVEAERGSLHGYCGCCHLQSCDLLHTVDQ